MEAPSIISIETKKPKENNMKFDTTELFKLDDIYILKISFNEEIIFFEVEEKDKFPKKDFNIFLSLEEISKINRYFYQFESLKEVFDSFKNLISKKNISIIKEDKLIKLKIKNPSNEKEFFFNIPLKEKDLKSELDSIVPYITSLNNRITELEKKVRKLENQFEECIPIINEYKEKKKKENEKIDLLSEGFKNSNIVNKEEIKTIYGWLEKKPNNCKLLLDSKIDGDKTETFYQKCGGKSPTIVLVKTTEGNRFGGYTSFPWENKNGGIINDNNSFIFSLNKMKKYNILNPKNAIETSKNYFAFGGIFSDFYIENNCHSAKNNYCDHRNRTYSTTEQCELNGGKRNFTVSSYEVYQIE